MYVGDEFQTVFDPHAPLLSVQVLYIKHYQKQFLYVRQLYLIKMLILLFTTKLFGTTQN